MGNADISLDQFLEEPLGRIVSRYSVQKLAAVWIKAEEAIAIAIKEPVSDATITDLRSGTLEWVNKYRIGGEVNGSRFPKLEAGLVSWYHAWMLPKSKSRKKYLERLSKNHQQKAKGLIGNPLDISTLEEDNKDLLVAITAKKQAAVSEAAFSNISKLDGSPQLYGLGAVLRYYIQDDIRKHMKKNKEAEKLSWLLRPEQALNSDSRDDVHTRTAHVVSGVIEEPTFTHRPVERMQIDCDLLESNDGMQELIPATTSRPFWACDDFTCFDCFERSKIRDLPELLRTWVEGSWLWMMENKTTSTHTTCFHLYMPKKPNHDGFILIRVDFDVCWRLCNHMV
jgi:hypothetical protein